jgi:hypothetical protein
VVARVCVCVLTQRPSQANFNMAMMTLRWSVEVVPDANTYERLLAVYSSYNPEAANGHDVISILLQQQAIARGAASSKLLTNMGNHYHNTQVGSTCSVVVI